jgi:catechol 2,3-dioxygenase-like lactoylglutathione lyase family enzyme
MGHNAALFEPRVSIITLGVADMRRSIGFYRDGLGFPTIAPDAPGWTIFKTGGVRLALYPRDKLAADIAPGMGAGGPGFGGITLAHNTRTRAAVDEILRLAERAGGRILKPAALADWGGYSGYFADPDGYPWEIAWSADWKFTDDGTLWGGSLGEPPAP